MVDINTAPAHKVEVPRKFHIALTDQEASVFTNDLQALRNMSPVTAQIFEYMIRRNS